MGSTGKQISTGLELLNDNDIEQLQRINGIELSPVKRCIHDLIHQRCLEQPGATAVHAWDGDLTYAELDVQSTKLASSLSQFASRPETFIPIFLEKSRWTPVAILAVMKSGGAFVLMSPSHPFRRLQNMCRTLGAPAVITDETHMDEARRLASSVIAVDSQVFPLRNPIEVKPDSSSSPEHAAYVVFTSGSTGDPKGVVISHESFVTAAQAFIKELHLAPGIRVLQFSSYAFDVSISDHLWTLIAGGCLCIPSEAYLLNNFNSVFRKFRVDWAMLTPSAVRLVSPTDLGDMQTLALIGEPLTRGDVTQWSRSVSLRVVYGPAEASVATTVQHSIGELQEATNIGVSPCARCWVVDPEDYQVLLPVGLEGELVIDGPIVSRGYLNDPHKTADYFVKDPIWLQHFRTCGPAKLYRTGDIVKMNADGSLTYVGRKDGQVKLRGQRIEIGEVEYHVQLCLPKEYRTVVDLVVSDGLHPMLVAFSCDILDQGPALKRKLFLPPTRPFLAASEEAQSKLEKYIPEYMIPRVFVRVTHIPSTASGKTDRRYLREQWLGLSKEDQLALTSADPEQSWAPSTAIEQKLQKLWADSLGIPASIIGCKDNFYKLGGDSLLAMRLAGMAHQAGLGLTVHHILQHPTIAESSKFVSSLHIEEEGGNVKPFSLMPNPSQYEHALQAAMDQCSVLKDEIEDLYPCTESQQAMVFLSEQHATDLTFFLKFHLGDLDVCQFKEAWRKVARAHPILRTRFVQTETGEYYQVVLREDLPVEDVDKPSEDRDNWAFGMPLLRLCLHRSSAGQTPHTFTFLIHHLLFDLHSIRLFFHDVQAAYNAEPIETKPFNTFVKSTLGVSDEAKNFWTTQLRGFRGVAFPPLPSANYMARQNMKMKFSIPMLGQVDASFTLTHKLRLALGIVISHHSNSRDVVFGASVMARGVPVPGIQRIGGPTVASVPFRVCLREENTILQEANKVKDASIEIVPFEHSGGLKIASMGAEAAAACSTNCLLFVHSDVLETFPPMFSNCVIGPERQPRVPGINIKCYISKHFLSVEARFDSHIISAEQMWTILHQLGQVFDLIETRSDTCIGDIKFVTPEFQDMKIEPII